jgi:hypothetical protein
VTRKGIPNFEPTEDERKLVEMLAGVGVSHDQMVLIEREDAEGVLRPISVDTLVRHFREETAKGKVRTTAKVAGKLVACALGNDSAQATASRIFYLKAQAGWRETVTVDVPQFGEVDGPDEVAIASRIASLLDKGRRQQEEAESAAAPETKH